MQCLFQGSPKFLYDFLESAGASVVHMSGIVTELDIVSLFQWLDFPQEQHYKVDMGAQVSTRTRQDCRMSRASVSRFGILGIPNLTGSNSDRVKLMI